MNQAEYYCLADHASNAFCAIMFRLPAILMILATSIYADESPLDYLIDCLRIDVNHGIVDESQGAIVWPKIIDREPTALTPWHGNTAKVTLKMPDDQVAKFLSENGFKRQRAVELYKEVPSLKPLFGELPSMYSVRLELPRLGSVEITAFSSADASGSSKIDLWITQFTAFFVRPQIEEVQAAAGQAATRSASDSKDVEKAEPDSDKRSR